MKKKDTEQKPPVAVSDDALAAVCGGTEAEVYAPEIPGWPGTSLIVPDPETEGITFVGAITEG